MTTNEIRKKFLDFFASKGHSIIGSDSLVPKDDPTVLFTTAGMQQFKPQFMGRIEGFTRAASCQKCLRTDDLDRVGKTAVHHTFFEMLGNFSFGDYFKKEAISWAWEFFTKELKIPEDRLWVSVYKDDLEAYDIWIKDIKLPTRKVVRLGDKSNFWPSNAKLAGPNGPCGPCSEIFYDYGVNADCPNPDQCNPDCDCGRFAEIWNLVFTQYNRKDPLSGTGQAEGILEPLPKKNIDTGMGLERLAAVMQGKKNNFEIDLFSTIIDRVREILPSIGLTESRIIADHMRAVTFGISDGVVPSNEGRGYVIKKLIILVSDLAIAAGASQAVVYQCVEAVIDVMKVGYPDLVSKSFEIANCVRRVEEGYWKLRKDRLPEFEQRARDHRTDSEKLGELLFKYHDTFGVSLSSSSAILTSLNIPKEILDKAYAKSKQLREEQQVKSRAGSKMTGDVFADTGVQFNVPKTKFLGYDHTSCEGVILKIFKDDVEVLEASQGQEVKIILDQTTFYAESGGQVGDVGTLWAPRVRIRVTDTQKFNDIYIHYAQIEEGQIRVGNTLGSQIDEDRRLDIMRNHTATHILQAVLREILGPHVKQQGSLVAQDRLRFDFTHPEGISVDDLKMVEDKVNRYILSCHPVHKEVMSIDKARQSGALAFFAEKYGDTVRVVSISQFSKEFCGGTHLRITGEIGPFKIIAEGAVAQGIRRIEAVTGPRAFDFIYGQESILKKISGLIKVPPVNAVDQIQNMIRRTKDLEKELERVSFIVIKEDVEQIIKTSIRTGNTILVAHVFDNVGMDVLRKVSDLIKQKEKSAVVVLGSRFQEDAHLLIAVTDDLVNRGFKAGEIVKDIAPLMGGAGGGRPQMAQAGSKQPEKIQAAVDKARVLMKDKLSQ